MTTTPERAELFLARILRCQDETVDQIELRHDVALAVATACGPALTVRLASMIMLAITLDGIDLTPTSSP